MSAGAAPAPPASVVLPYAAVLLQTTLASFTFLVAKAALVEIPPAKLFSLRVLTAVPLLFALWWRFRGSLSPGEGRRLWLLGLLGVPLNQGLFLWGLESTTPTRAALLFALTPLFVAIVARRVLGEPLHRGRLAGIAIGFAGVAVVLAERGLEAAPGALSGDLTVLGAVVCWSLYSVLGKPLVERHGTMAVTAASLLCGTALMIPFEVWALWDLAPGSISAAGWGAVLFLALVTSVTSYLLWYYALRRLPAGRVAIFMNLQPVLTAALSVTLLDEVLTASLFGGGALVIAGVVLVQRR